MLFSWDLSLPHTVPFSCRTLHKYCTISSKMWVHLWDIAANQCFTIRIYTNGKIYYRNTFKLLNSWRFFIFLLFSIWENDFACIFLFFSVRFKLFLIVLWVWLSTYLKVSWHYFFSQIEQIIFLVKLIYFA